MLADLTAIVLSVLIPWVAGGCLARYVLGTGHSTSLYLGHGFLVGYALVLVWLRLFNAAGIELAFWPVLAGVSVVGAAYAILLWRKRVAKTLPGSHRLHRAELNDARPFWHWFLATLLLLATLTQIKFVYDEVLLRPTFPWDAWRGWEPETLQHFGSKTLVASLQTVGNYGTVASQVHLWTMLAASTGKAPITHIPWLFAYIALGLAVFGHLRSLVGMLPSLIGAFACLSLPYLTIHASLAGYADIWLTLAYTLGVLLLSMIYNERRPGHFLLLTIYFVLTLLSKRAGIPMSIALLSCLVFLLVRWTPARAAIVASIPVFLSVGIAAARCGYVVIDVNLPFLGHLEINEEHIQLPFVMKYTFDLSTNITPYVEALLLFDNWHLTTALFIVCVVMLPVQRHRVPLTIVPVFGVFSAAVLIIGFFLAFSPESAKEQTALSRALLYIAPLAVFSIIAISVKRNIEPR